MYKMPRSPGIILSKNDFNKILYEAEKRRIVTPEFIEQCKRTRMHISPEAMAEMDKLFNESRKNE